MECIIVDAGPIIALCKVKRLSLLSKLFAHCIVTPQVYQEVIVGHDDSVDCLKSAIENELIKIQNCTTLMPELENILDPGEASSITLAKEQPNSALLIDEYKGRQIAKRLQLNVIGLAGLLILAKKKRHISSVIPILLEIRQKGYWLSDKFLHEISVIAEEQSVEN